MTGRSVDLPKKSWSQSEASLRIRRKFMCASKKEFKTFEEQIEKLKSNGMIFGSEETTIKCLKRFGYYNIIHGYRDPYIKSIASGKQYCDGVTFEQVFSLYNLDRKIRNIIMEAMLEFEDILRSATAHVIAESFSADESMYLQKTNYKLGSKRGDKYQLDDIFSKFNHIRNDKNQPFTHYRENHKNIPPWILLKGASFGNIANFIKLQKSEQKNKIVALLYDFPKELVETFPDIKQLCMDTIFVCLQYRNIAAHGGRIYNFIPSATFRYTPILHERASVSKAEYRQGRGVNDIPTLIVALSLLDHALISVKMKFQIESAIDEHCNNYPNDREYLMKFIDTSKFLSQ